MEISKFLIILYHTKKKNSFCLIYKKFIQENLPNGWSLMQIQKIAVALYEIKQYKYIHTQRSQVTVIYILFQPPRGFFSQSQVQNSQCSVLRKTLQENQRKSPQSVPTFLQSPPLSEAENCHQNNIPFSIALSIRRVCSREEDCKIRLEQMRQDLLSRSYPPKNSRWSHQTCK